MKTDKKLQDLSDWLENILQIGFKLEEDDEFTIYKSDEFKGGWIYIQAHPFLNLDDKELDFENYSYELEVSAPRNWRTEEGKTAQTQFAYDNFEKLKATRTCDLLMVEDLEILLEKYNCGE